MSKPRLYIDIDGVVYGHYAGQWQIRPYVRTLTAWAEQFFDIYWVSFNSRKKQVVETCYAHGEVVIDYWDMTKDERGFNIAVHPDWHPLAIKSEKLQAIHKTGGLKGEWFIIEDTPPNEVQQEILEQYGASHRWIVVPDTGSDVLLEVKHILEKYGETGKLIVPFEWATREAAERDLWTGAEWKGYGKSGR